MKSPKNRQTNSVSAPEGRSPTKNDRGIHAPAVRTASLMTDHSINSLFVRPATQLSFERRAAALRCVASEVEERTNIVSYRNRIGIGNVLRTAVLRFVAFEDIIWMRPAFRIATQYNSVSFVFFGAVASILYSSAVRPCLSYLFLWLLRCCWTAIALIIRIGSYGATHRMHAKIVNIAQRNRRCCCHYYRLLSIPYSSATKLKIRSIEGRLLTCHYHYYH